MRSVIRKGLVLSLFALAGFAAGGCSGGASNSTEGGPKDTKVAKDGQAQSGKDKG